MSDVAVSTLINHIKILSLLAKATAEPHGHSSETRFYYDSLSAYKNELFRIITTVGGEEYGNQSVDIIYVGDNITERIIRHFAEVKENYLSNLENIPKDL